MNYIWEGILIGLAASIPLGPIAILIIQRTLNKGWKFGFLSGLGAACADTFYAILAALGVTMITSYIEKYEIILRIIGSIILIIMGIKLIPIKPTKQLKKNYLKTGKKAIVSDFFSIYGLTLSNPITFFVFTAFFATFRVIDGTITNWYLGIVILLFSIFFGAVSWWCALTLLVSVFRKKIRLRKMLILNRIAGILMILFAIFVIVSVFLPKEYQFF
ncbi:MAG: LysE family translocator [Bacteroidales bacterium]|jgi:threonine/homoserine/homoserine lactone efflux protein|nr:LysE family translocator [Bacteroidales bacterium]